MKDIIEGAEYLNIPIIVVSAIIGIYLVINLITAILDFKGKVAPEFINLRKFFRTRREKKQAAKQLIQKQGELLEKVNTTLTDINQHYSADHITKRDEWIHWVDDRAKVYDNSVEVLSKTVEKLDEVSILVYKSYLHDCVDRILHLADLIGGAEGKIPQERFQQAFELHEEYEKLVEKTHDPNHRVDTAWEVITNAYKESFKK